MSTLIELCTLVRSKNAGPFWLTFDVMCRDRAAYDLVTKGGALSAHAVARLYAVDSATVQIFHHPAALAVKISMPRPRIQGSAGETDMYGGQQQALLIDLVIEA